MQIMINRGEEVLRISPKECKRIQFSTNHGRIHGWFAVMVHQILVLSTHRPKSCINEKTASGYKFSYIRILFSNAVTIACMSLGSFSHVKV